VQNETALEARKVLRSQMVNAIAQKLNPDADFDGKILFPFDVQVYTVCETTEGF